MLDGRGARAVELHQIAVERGVGRALADELEVRRDLRALLRAAEERVSRGLDGPGGQGNLPAGRDAHLPELADGLSRGGEHASHAVHLVAEELDAHGRAGLGGEDVHGIAMDVEAARHAHVAGVSGVRIAHGDQEPAHVLELELVSHGEAGGGEVARAHGGHAPQEGVRARHDHAGLAGSQAGNGVAAGAHHGVVGRLVGPGPVPALGVAAHQLAPQPCREGAGGAVGGLLARDDQEAGSWVAHPERGGHEGACALGHA